MGFSLRSTLAAIGFACFGGALDAHAQSVGISEFSSNTRTGGAIAYQATSDWGWTVPAGQYLAFAKIAYTLQSNLNAASLRCNLHRPNEGFLDIAVATITGTTTGGISTAGEMTLISPVSLQAPTALIVTCDAPFGGPSATQRVEHLRLELVQASTLASIPVASIPVAAATAPAARR